MNLIKQLGAMAIGTRLRLLTDIFGQEGAKVYRSLNIDFEPRWFPIFYMLSRKTPLTITQITSELGYTQPGVTQIVDILLEMKLVKTIRHSNDNRKKMLVLSQKGMDLLPILKPVWEGFDSAINELFRSTGFDILFILDKLETGLAEKGICERVTEKIKQKQMEEIEIVNYSPQNKKYFRDLNYEWLKKYFKIEKYDRAILNDPETHILNKGGSIFFAKLHDEIIGTCALLKQDKDTYELSKMAVTEKAQGRQAGKKLALAAIKKARACKAKTLFLGTSTKLQPAFNLYEKLGFVQVETNLAGKYERETIKMQLEIS